MKRPMDKRRQMLLWILSLVVALSMICPFTGLCGTSREPTTPTTTPTRVTVVETPTP